MFLGALVDLGVPLRSLKKGLNALSLEGYRLTEKQVIRNSLRATKVDVHIRSGFDRPLSFSQIRTLLSKSALPSKIKSQALRTFQTIAEAEGAVHGKSPGRVHFHEVGVIDSLVDIVGTLLGIATLEIDSISVSPINVGGGMVRTAHGQLPVPGPAVAQMAQGLPIFSSGPSIELTTPTGIALAKTLTQDCRPLPALTPTKVGYGAATADPKDWPNVLRCFLSDSPTNLSETEERIIQLETNIDDLNPQVFQVVVDHLLEAGALDVTLTPTVMKRGRPGIIVTVLCFPQDQYSLTTLLFSETPTLGIRVQSLERTILPRTFQTIRVLGKPIKVKIAELGNGRIKVSPEFRDCLALAKTKGRPVQDILELAKSAFAKTYPKNTKAKTSSRSKTR